MAKKKSKPSLSKGNVVKIIESSDDSLIGCTGEVVEEEPLTIAIVHVKRFETKQVKKLFDTKKDHWDSVRKEAIKLGIKVEGRKDELVAKIAEHHASKGSTEVENRNEEVAEDVVAVRTRSVGGGQADTSAYRVNDCVFVKPRKNARGRVTALNDPKPGRHLVKFCHPNIKKLVVSDFLEKHLTKAGTDVCPDPTNCGPTCKPDGGNCPNCWPAMVKVQR